MSPHGTYHGTHVAHISPPPPPQNMTIQSSSPAHTPEHKSAWHYSHTNTVPPTQTVPAASTTPQTTFAVGLGTAKTMVPKKTKNKNQKCRNTGSLCLGKPVLGQVWGGGVPVIWQQDSRRKGSAHTVTTGGQQTDEVLGAYCTPGSPKTSLFVSEHLRVSPTEIAGILEGQAAARRVGRSRIQEGHSGIAHALTDTHARTEQTSRARKRSYAVS